MCSALQLNTSAQDRSIFFSPCKGEPLQETVLKACTGSVVMFAAVTHESHKAASLTRRREAFLLSNGRERERRDLCPLSLKPCSCGSMDGLFSFSAFYLTKSGSVDV